MISIKIDGLEKIVKEQKAKANKATYRALNATSTKGIRQIALWNAEDWAIKQATTRKAIKVRKAYSQNPVVQWSIKGYRLDVPGLRAIKRKKRVQGISYLGYKRKRIKKQDYVRAGASKPFVITGINSGKQVAVYVPDNTAKRSRKGGGKFSGRGVKTYKGHSVPWAVQREWIRRLNKFVADNYIEEYKKQLTKVGYG